MPPITSEYLYFSQDNLIWFSTAQGLASFDGSEVIVHSKLDETNRFGLNRIAAMTEDQEHNIYIGTHLGLIFFNRIKNRFELVSFFFGEQKESALKNIDALYWDKAGLLYAGTANHGLFVYDPKQKRVSHFNLLSGKPDDWLDYHLNTVRCFGSHYSDSSKLWIGTFNGIYLLDKRTMRLERRFSVSNPAPYLMPANATLNYDIEKMDVPDDSTIWFNCWAAGFGRYNTQTGNVKLFLQDAQLDLPDKNIGYIIPGFDRYAPGKYLLGIFDGKTALFDAEKGEATYFNISGTPNEIEQNRFVTRDRQGNVWVLQRGLLYVSMPDHLRLKSRPIKRPDQIHIPQLRSMYYDSVSGHYAGALFVGGGVGIYDTLFNLTRVIKVPEENNYFTYNAAVVNRVVVDRTGAFWAIGDRLYRCGKTNGVFVPAEKKFPGMAGLNAGIEAPDIQNSRSGKLLFRKNSSMVFLIDPVTGKMDSVKIITKALNEVEIKAASAWYDPNRDIVYLSQRSAIIQYDLSRKLQREIPFSSLFGSLPADQGVCVSALDRSGGIWFLIPKFGLRRIDPVTLKCTDSIAFGEKGLIRGDYTSFIGAEHDLLVFRSLNGVVVYDFRHHSSFLFDRGNDLSSPEIKSLFYCNGYLFIGQMGSFQYYRLSDLSKYNLPLQPVLNSIFSDTLQIYTRAGRDSSVEIYLPYYHRSLRFNFSASEFFFPERIEYAYQLEGIDNDWKFTNSRDRMVSYGNLKPGKYIFRLKAQRWGGNWEVQDEAYIIHIRPAFWQESWFGILEFILAVCLLILINLLRERYVRKREARRLAHEKELTELEAKALRAQMNPHFIFNCLNSIKVLIQDKENEKGIVYLTTFSKLIRTLFNNADKKEITLFDEIETCKYYLQLESMRFDSRFSYNINIDPLIDLKSITVPALVIQPFIENAIWHGIMPRNSGGTVSLNIRCNGDTVEIEIEDDGIGRESSRLNKASTGVEHHSKGVSLTEARLKLNNLLYQKDAQITIIDKMDIHDVPLGTKILITIKEE